MQSRAGVMWRGLYGTWVHLSSAFWLTPRKTLQIHCTTVCTINIHPRYFIGSVLIQKKKKNKWLNELNAASNKAQHFFAMISRKKEMHAIYCVCCVGTLSKQTWLQTWQYPLMLSWPRPSHKTGATFVTCRVSFGVDGGGGRLWRASGGSLDFVTPSIPWKQPKIRTVMARCIAHPSSSGIWRGEIIRKMVNRWKRRIVSFFTLPAFAAV